MRRRTTVLATALAVLVVLAPAAACGGGTTTTSSAPSTPDAADTDRAARSGVPEVLRFTAPIVGGGELDATTLAGQAVAFWFWAPT